MASPSVRADALSHGGPVQVALYASRETAAPGAATSVVERPPEGPAQGPLPAPAWLVWLLSGSLALAAILFFVRSWRRRRS